MKRKSWVKLWTHETLYGTTSKELKPDERCIWFSFLALAGDSVDDGVVCIAPGLAYTDNQLGTILNCSPSLIFRAKKRMTEVGKITINPDDTVTINNWQKYQSEYNRQKPYRLQGIVTEKVTTDSDKESLQVHTEGDGDGEEEQKQRENIYGLYENLCGTINPIIADDLKLAEKEYSPEWINDAFKEAARLNKRSWKYVEAILKRWKSEGRGEPTFHREIYKDLG